MVTYQLLKDRDPISNESFTLDENGTPTNRAVLDYEKNASLFIVQKQPTRQDCLPRKDSWWK